MRTTRHPDWARNRAARRPRPAPKRSSKERRQERLPSRFLQVRTSGSPLPPIRWSRLRDLHADPVGILDVQSGIVALQGSRTTLCQIAPSGLRGETRYPDGEVVDHAGRASIVERDQHLGVTEANNSLRPVLAHHREAEHSSIKIDGALQVRDMKADVVDIRGLKIDIFLSGRGGGRSARSQNGETSNQISAV